MPTAGGVQGRTARPYAVAEMTDTHHHGSSALDLPDPDQLIAIVRSVQAELGDAASGEVSTQLDQVADGVAALDRALDTERAYSAHVKKHFVECEESSSYRIGHAIVRAGKAPKQLIASLRSGRS